MKFSHPGEIISDEYLKPAGRKAADLARATGLSTGRVSELLRGKRDITAEIAIRLERATNISARFWLGLQNDYDLSAVSKKKAGLIRRQTRRLPASDGHATA